jgi:uncharacterized protein (DUF2132 family)
MEKKITTIYIDQDLKDFFTEFNINLSEWVNERARIEYFGIEPRIKQIEEHMEKVEFLRNEIKNLKIKAQNRLKLMKKPEIDLLFTLKHHQKEGFSSHSLYKRFIFETKKTMPYGEFIEVLSEIEAKTH